VGEVVRALSLPPTRPPTTREVGKLVQGQRQRNRKR